jgi:FMN phosphatase YigB (HAD superfamily)
MEPALVLWDFGDTLADETWMLRAPEGVPEWTAAYQRHVIDSSDLVDAWSAGRATAADVARRLASALELDVAATVGHMHDACRQLRFFPTVMAAVRARRRRGLAQALVTVNADVFSDIVVPQYGLDELFDTIVNSCLVGTVDKVELCDIAMVQLGNDRYDSTLLIDNIEENVRRFEDRGGLGYVFTDEATFHQDVTKGVLPASLR